MTRYLPHTWLLAAAILVTLSYVGPAIDDNSDDRAQADALQDAIKTSAAHDRFAKAAQALCGPNAGWAELPDGAVQCSTKQGHKTARVAVVQP